MKPFKVIFLSGIALCLSSCMAMYGPTYFGSEYAPTEQVDVFYSARDIKQPFKVIGHMNAPTGPLESSNETTKEYVIKKAKQVGADAVIFSQVDRQTNHKTTDDLSVKVEVVQYLNKQ